MGRKASWKKYYYANRERILRDRRKTNKLKSLIRKNREEMLKSLPPEELLKIVREKQNE